MDELELVRACEASDVGFTRRAQSRGSEKNLEGYIVPVELGNTTIQAEGRYFELLDFEKLSAPLDPTSGLAGDGLSASTPVDERLDTAVPELPKPRVLTNSRSREELVLTNTSTSIPRANDWEALKAYARQPSSLPTETLDTTAPLPSLLGLESVDSSAPPLCFQPCETFYLNKLQSSPTPLAVHPAPARLCQSGASNTFTVHSNSTAIARPQSYVDYQMKQDPSLECLPAHLNRPPGFVHPAVRQSLKNGEEQAELVVGLCKESNGDVFVEHELENFLAEGAAEEVNKEGYACHGRPKLKSKTKNKQGIMEQRPGMNKWRTDETISSQPQSGNLEEEDGEEERHTINAREIWAEVRRVLGNTEWAYGCSHPVLARCVPPVSFVRVQGEGEGTGAQ